MAGELSYEELAGAAPATVAPPTPVGVAAVPPVAGASASPTYNAGAGLSYEQLAAGQPPTTAALPTNEGLGFVEGLTKPLDNLAGWIDQGPVKSVDERIASYLGIPSTAQATAQRQQGFATAEQSYRPGAMGKFAGEVLGTLPTAMVPGGVLAQGAASGALLSDSKNLQGIAKDAALGGVGGYLGGKVLGGVLGGFASPKIAPQAQALLNEGVRLTPGQMLGGTAQRLEDAATSVPVFGDAIRTAQRQSLGDFNRAAINRALTPVGESLSPNIAGRDAIAEAQSKLSDAYKNALTGSTLTVDKGLADDLINNVGPYVSTLTPDRAAQLHSILADRVGARFAGGTTITDEGLNKVDGELGNLARRYSKSPDADQQELGDALEHTQNALRDMVERQNPAQADKLRAARTGYAALTRVERAASGAGARDGVFTAPQLSAAVKAGDSSVRNRAYAAGDAFMQDLSDAGTHVLPSTVPDSGTALRWLTGELPMLIGFGAESSHFAPQLGMAMGLMGTAGLPYTKMGQKAAQFALTKRPWSPAQSEAVINQVKGLLAGAGATGAVNSGLLSPQPAQ